jgi:hypothetical protein
MSIAHPREFTRKRGSHALSGIEAVSEAARSSAFPVHCPGEKAEQLSRLVAAGAMVPPFFVIDAQWLARIVEEGGRERVISLPLPAALELEITRGLSSLGDGPFAVRSSRVGEKPTGARASFLFRRTRREVEEAVRGCWLAALEERTGGLPEVGVVVQLMIEGQVSGVCLTADAASGRRDRILLGAAHGLDAHGTRDELALDHEGHELEAHIADKRRELVRAEDGCGTRQLEVEAPRRTARALTRGEASAIARECARIAAELGQPQAITWTVRKGTLYVLHSRPIENLKTPPNSDGPRLSFERGKLGDALTTPLAYSLLVRSEGRAISEALGLLGVSAQQTASLPLASLFGLVRGRVYYNVPAWQRLLALLPVPEHGRALAGALGLGEVPLEAVHEPGLAAALRRFVARRKARRSLRAVARGAAAWAERCEAIASELAREAGRESSYSQGMALFLRAERELFGALPLLHASCVTARSDERGRLAQCSARARELVHEVARGLGQRLCEAGKLERAADVEYLTLEELEAYHEGRAVSAELAPIAAARKAELESYEVLVLPPRFETLGPVYHGNAL